MLLTKLFDDSCCVFFISSQLALVFFPAACTLVALDIWHCPVVLNAGGKDSFACYGIMTSCDASSGAGDFR